MQGGKKFTKNKNYVTVKNTKSKLYAKKYRPKASCYFLVVAAFSQLGTMNMYYFCNQRNLSTQL